MTTIGIADLSATTMHALVSDDGVNQTSSLSFNSFLKFYQVDAIQSDESVASRHVWEELNRQSENRYLSQTIENSYENSTAQFNRVAEIWDSFSGAGQLSNANTNASISMDNAPSIQNEENELADILQSYYSGTHDENRVDSIEASSEYGFHQKYSFFTDQSNVAQQPPSDGQNSMQETRMQETREAPLAVSPSFSDAQGGSPDEDYAVDLPKSGDMKVKRSREYRNLDHAKEMREYRKSKKKNDPIGYAADLEKERARKALKKEADPVGFKATATKYQDAYRKRQMEIDPEGYAERKREHNRKFQNRRKAADPVGFDAYNAQRLREYRKRKKETDLEVDLAKSRG